jgi:hypothetical protein
MDVLLQYNPRREGGYTIHQVPVFFAHRARGSSVLMAPGGPEVLLTDRLELKEIVYSRKIGTVPVNLNIDREDCCSCG